MRADTVGLGSASGTPTIRASDGPTGTYAVASGLESARIDAEGGTVAVTGVVGGDATPAEVHLFPDAALERAETDLSLELVRGSSETAVNSHVGVVVHTETGLSDSGLVWRNGDAMPTDGSSRYGEVLERGDSGEKKVIRTYTDSDGRVTVGVENSPNAWDRVRHWASHTLPDMAVPYWIGGIVVPLVTREVVG